MEIKTFTYELIDSKMYIITENQKAIIIDPNISEGAAELLRTKQVKEVTIILTHEHYDHISGVEWFRERFDCTVYCSEECDKNARSSLRNGSKYFKALFMDKEAAKLEEASNIAPFECSGDITFKGEKTIEWEEHRIVLTETPGHSPGSICALMDDRYIFTGDSLIQNEPVITRLPGGSRKEYEEITLPFLQSLDKKIYVYPGHGDSGWMNDFELNF